MDENTLSNQIIGAAIEVHKQMGPGLLESIYQSTMECELSLRQIPYERQKQLPVVYKGKSLDLKYQLDLLVDGLVVVELIRALRAFVVITYAHLVSC